MMLKINRKVEYALMAIKYMATEKKDAKITAKEIGQKFNIPVDTMAKILQALCHSHIVTSIQGVKGGYILATSLSEISYLGLFEIVGEKISGLKCLELPENCEYCTQCNIKEPLHLIHVKVLELFKDMTLQELLFPPTPMLENHLKNHTVLRIKNG